MFIADYEQYKARAMQIYGMPLVDADSKENILNEIQRDVKQLKEDYNNLVVDW